MQKAFKNMREKVALSIHLVQPDDSHDYIINTDTSNKAISAVLMQKNELGHVNIISTASRVLTPPERRYTTRALELLAIIFALRKLSVIYDCCVCIQLISHTEMPVHIRVAVISKLDKSITLSQIRLTSLDLSES